MIWLRLTEVVRKEDILIWQRFYRVPSSEHNVLINSFTQFAQSHSPKRDGTLVLPGTLTFPRQKLSLWIRVWTDT